MAHWRILSKRLLSSSHDAFSPTTTVKECASASVSDLPNLDRSRLHQDSISSPDLPVAGIFCYFIQRRALNHQSAAIPLQSFLTLPAGEELREKLKCLNVPIGDERLHLDVLVLSPPFAPLEECKGRPSVDVTDLKKLLKFAQLEKVRRRLRNIPASTITYGEFVHICGDT